MRKSWGGYPWFGVVNQLFMVDLFKLSRNLCFDYETFESNNEHSSSFDKFHDLSFSDKNGSLFVWHAPLLSLSNMCFSLSLHGCLVVAKCMLTIPIYQHFFIITYA